MLNVRDNLAPIPDPAGKPLSDPAETSPPVPPVDVAAEPPVAPEPVTSPVAAAMPGAASVAEPAAERSHLVLPAPTLAEQLRALRVEAGLTLDEVAEKIRCAREVLEALEGGDYEAISMRPHYLRATLARLGALYAMEADVLLERLEEEFPSGGGAGVDDAGRGGSFLLESGEEAGAEAENRLQRISTVLIVSLLVLLVGLLLSAWVVQHFRKTRDAAIRQEIEQILPELIVPERVPLEVLPVPQN